jgi:hypothetical protein
MPSTKLSRGHRFISAWCAIALAAGALTLLFWLPFALSADDTEALESPLVLAVARQLVVGPFELYGPYGPKNPLVLIHAPFYYHMAALAAWPFYRLGLDPVSASLLAGRALSAMGFAVVLIGAFCLARADGAPRRAAWLAVCLVAATPIHGGLEFEVRPDFFGLAFQMVGILLVCRALLAHSPRTATILVAFVAFGMAISIKQLYMIAPAVSAGLLWISWHDRPRKRIWIIVAIAVSVFLPMSVYCLEELLTGGRMSRAVFVAARATVRVHPADWMRSYMIMLSVVWKSIGWLTVWMASLLGAIAAGMGAGRRAVTVLGTLIVGWVVFLAFIQFFMVHNIVSALIGYSLIGLVALVAIFPSADRQSWRASWPFDRVVGVYLAAELLQMIVLFRLSTGAWYNYAIQGVVLGCVLAARALDRALSRASSGWSLAAVTLAVITVPVFALTDVRQVVRKRFTDRAAIAQITAMVGRPRQQYFFAGRPGDNRLRGRVELVYDDWLYPVFESIGLAEPRRLWLRQALLHGPIRVVVTESSSDRIDGVPESLPSLGYGFRFQVGTFRVWERPG